MQQDMTKGSILPILLKFVLPLFIGNVFQQLYNMADTIIVGRYVGAKALAAVGSTGTLMFLIQGFAAGITAGLGILTSQRFGAKDEDGVKRSVGNGIILGVLITALLTAVSLLALPFLLRIMNTPADILKDAKSYITIIVAGLCATMFYNMFSTFLRSIGNSRAPLMFLVFSAVLNVFLDLFFIIAFHMGTAGAAIATIISQAISALLSLFYMLKRAPILIPHRNQLRLYKEESANQLKMGIPMALQFSITASGTMVAQSAVNLFGSTAVAAYTAASKAQNLLIQGFFSMGQAMATYIGQNAGVGDIRRIRKGANCAVEIIIVYAIGTGLLVFFTLPHLVGLFFSGSVDMNAMMPYVRQYIYPCILTYLFLGFIFIFRNSMQGCGYALIPMSCGIVELIARFVTAFLGMHFHSYQLSVMCDPAAWVLAGIYSLVCFKIVLKDFEKKLSLKEMKVEKKVAAAVK